MLGRSSEIRSAASPAAPGRTARNPARSGLRSQQSLELHPTAAEIDQADECSQLRISGLGANVQGSAHGIFSTTASRQRCRTYTTPTAHTRACNKHHPQSTFNNSYPGPSFLRLSQRYRSRAGCCSHARKQDTILQPLAGYVITSLSSMSCLLHRNDHTSLASERAQAERAEPGWPSVRVRILPGEIAATRTPITEPVSL